MNISDFLKIYKILINWFQTVISNEKHIINIIYDIFGTLLYTIRHILEII